MSDRLTTLINDNTILEIVVGSHAYGLNIKESDEDIGGVCIIPDKSYYIGRNRFDLKDSWVGATGSKIDKTIFAISKIISLMLDNNPNALDYLFVPERCIRVLTPEWKQFMDIRDDFLSSRLRFTLSGYSHAQIQRVKNHRQYLLHPILKKPERVDYGLPEISEFPPTQLEAIARISTDFVKQELKKDFHNECVSLINSEFYLLFLKYMEREMANIALNTFQKDMINWYNMLCSIQSVFLREEWIDKAQKELSYLHAKREYDSYINWKTTRNDKRKELEAKCGYDSKHICHSIRLCRVGVEVLSGKGYNIDRTNIDADELKDIRLGNQPFENVMNIADKALADVEELYKTTSLQKNPKRDKVETMLQETVDKYVWEGKRG